MNHVKLISQRRGARITSWHPTIKDAAASGCRFQETAVAFPTAIEAYGTTIWTGKTPFEVGYHEALDMLEYWAGLTTIH